MRIRTLACLSLVAGACAVAATGFPRRIGLTASQADVSLPGDLILPGANVVVDRGIAIDAPASVVWDVLGHVFEPEDESTIIDIEDEDHILMRVAPPAAPEGAEASGTCVIALLPLSLAWAGVAAESLSSLSMLRDLRDACVGGLVDA